MLLLSSLEEVSQERGLGKVIISIFFVFIPGLLSIFTINI